MKYQSIPKVVEATQWFPGLNVYGVYREERLGLPETFYVITAQRRHVRVSPGEWIVTEDDGEHHYPIAEDLFPKRYRPLKEEPS